MGADPDPDLHGDFCRNLDAQKRMQIPTLLPSAFEGSFQIPLNQTGLVTFGYGT
jgi:hypothetical protein